MQTQARPQTNSQPTHIRALGFGESPSGLAIFCNRANTNTWYTLDRDSQPQEISYSALTGYLQSLEFIKGEYKSKPTCKLRFKILAHRPCTLEAGAESTFARGFLMAIASLTPDQLHDHPITIEAIPADDDKVLFCSVWLGTEKVFQKWDESTDWRAIAMKAKDNVAHLQQGG
jgi:hypothetical protein